MVSEQIPAPSAVTVTGSFGVITSYCAGAHLIAAAGICSLLLPHVVWILSDRRAWPHDQAYYAAATLDLWHAQGMDTWLTSMVTALRSMPPLLPWFAQFLVPLGGISPDVESAMLLVNVVFLAAILVLAYATARRMECSLLEALATVTLVGGSTLMVGLSHQYLVELSQTFAAAVIIAVSWQIERRSWARSSALLIIAISAAQAAKASSFVFTVPLLFYCAVVCALTWKNKRPVSTVLDVALLAGALGFLALTAAWYYTNWDHMIAHFRWTTVGDAALNWGFHPVDLRWKIPFWFGGLSTGISAIAILPVAALALICLALAFGVKRALAGRLVPTIYQAIETGTLFALALAGTILVVILAFSLQLNEDLRFLAPIVAFVGVLTAWSLSAPGLRWLSFVFLATFLVNAIVNHAASFGANPLRITPSPWIMPPDQDSSQRKRLAAVVAATCSPETAGRWIVLAVDYGWLNQNSATFFAAKDSWPPEHRCRYANIPLFEKDIEKHFAFIDMAQAYYVITQEPSKQPAPDFINDLAKPIAERLGKDERFVLTINIGDILVYRRRP